MQGKLSPSQVQRLKPPFLNYQIYVIQMTCFYDELCITAFIILLNLHPILEGTWAADVQEKNHGRIGELFQVPLSFLVSKQMRDYSLII